MGYIEKFILFWLVSGLVGTLIGVLVRRKLNISKKVNFIIFTVAYLAPLLISFLLENYTDIPLEDAIISSNGVKSPKK